MTTSISKTDPVGVEAQIDDAELRVRLADGREVSVPLEWFPSLAAATPEARKHWRWIGGGIGMHWPDLDEDISIAGLLAGR
jgi:hypothetical protein